MKSKKDASCLGMSLAIALGICLVAGCAVEGMEERDDPEPAEGELALGDPAAADPSPGEEELVFTAEAAAGNGCSIVQWCNQSGPEGTICQQLGCAENTAIAECRREVTRICGAPVCPWYFVRTNGSRRNLCDCSPNCNLTEEEED